MSANKNYYIKIGGQLVPVTEEIYREYHKMGRREKYLAERDAVHGTFNYSDRDTEEMSGEETIADTETPSVAQIAINAMMIERLYKCLDLLSDKERELVDALFYKEMGEREYAKILGISKTALHARKVKILELLKKYMES